MSPLTILLETFDHLSRYQDTLAQLTAHGTGEAVDRYMQVRNCRRHLAALIARLETDQDLHTQQQRLPL